MILTQECINDVYIRISETGEKPTVRATREELIKKYGKGGSSDDIARFLRVAKETNGKTMSQRIEDLEQELRNLKELLRNRF